MFADCLLWLLIHSIETLLGFDKKGETLDPSTIIPRFLIISCRMKLRHQRQEVCHVNSTRSPTCITEYGRQFVMCRIFVNGQFLAIQHNLTRLHHTIFLQLRKRFSLFRTVVLELWITVLLGPRRNFS